MQQSHGGVGGGGLVVVEVVALWCLSNFWGLKIGNMKLCRLRLGAGEWNFRGLKVGKMKLCRLRLGAGEQDICQPSGDSK